MAKGFGKSLMGLFVQSDEEENSKAPSETPTNTGIPPETPKQRTIPEPAGAQDEQIAQILSETLEKANLEGFDYFEFAKIIDFLKPTLPAEQTLYQTAFISGNTMGATKEKLIQAANFYLDVLKKKANEFEGTCQSKIQETVTIREKELKDMETAIQEKATTIQKLTEEINQMTLQKTKVTNEISENRIKIETKRNNFNATLQLFTNRISTDIEKISKYIQ